MSNGIITTSRGNALNIDELIRKAQSPVGSIEAASTRENPNYTSQKSVQPKLRGYVPSQGEATPPVGEEAVSPTEVEVEKAKAKVSKGGKKSLAEHTKVTVKKTAETKKPSANTSEEEVSEEDETLGSIIDEMDE